MFIICKLYKIKQCFFFCLPSQFDVITFCTLRYTRFKKHQSNIWMLLLNYYMLGISISKWNSKPLYMYSLYCHYSLTNLICIFVFIPVNIFVFLKWRGEPALLKQIQNVIFSLVIIIYVCQYNLKMVSLIVWRLCTT